MVTDRRPPQPIEESETYIMVAHNMVTTAFELDGFHIKQNLGIVRITK